MLAPVGEIAPLFVLFQLFWKSIFRSIVKQQIAINLGWRRATRWTRAVSRENPGSGAPQGE
jgi:hypothetical protein